MFSLFLNKKKKKKKKKTLPIKSKWLFRVHMLQFLFIQFKVYIMILFCTRLLIAFCLFNYLNHWTDRILRWGYFFDFLYFFLSELAIVCLWLICFWWMRLCSLGIFVTLIEFVGVGLESSDSLIFYRNKNLGINEELGDGMQVRVGGSSLELTMRNSISISYKLSQWY